MTYDYGLGMMTMECIESVAFNSIRHDCKCQMRENHKFNRIHVLYSDISLLYSDISLDISTLFL